MLCSWVTISTISISAILQFANCKKFPGRGKGVEMVRSHFQKRFGRHGTRGLGLGHTGAVEPGPVEFLVTIQPDGFCIGHGNITSLYHRYVFPEKVTKSGFSNVT